MGLLLMAYCQASAKARHNEHIWQLERQVDCVDVEDACTVRKVEIGTARQHAHCFFLNIHILLSLSLCCAHNPAVPALSAVACL